MNSPKRVSANLLHHSFTLLCEFYGIKNVDLRYQEFYGEDPVKLVVKTTNSSGELISLDLTDYLTKREMHIFLNGMRGILHLLNQEKCRKAGLTSAWGVVVMEVPNG